jgi:NAD(P)-dependent dehydrogenase (short-subunit alcohol dehydrogenase family)
MANWTADDIGDQSGRVAVVTGANSGIGYIAALELARHGATVVVASRSPERGQAAVQRIQAEGIEGQAHFLELDLASLASVRAFAEAFLDRFDRLDLLINNAGVMATPEAQTKDGFELQLGTNHLGHFALTGQLVERMIVTPGSRVVTVSSMAHRQGEMDFDDLHSRNKSYSRWGVYGQSKLANLLFTFELNRRLAAAGAPTIAVAAHPGWTATNLQRTSLLARALNPLLAMKPEQGALPTLFAAVGEPVAGGDYIGPDGWGEARGYPTQVGTTDAARSLEDAARLWRESVAAVGVNFRALDASSIGRAQPVHEAVAVPVPAAD